MTVRKLDDGKKNPWLCDLYPQGRKGKRVRKRFATKGEALAYEKFILVESNDKPWLTEKSDNRRLSALIELWFQLHGKQLKSGAHARRRMEIISEQMLNPLARTLTPTDFVQYRAGRKTISKHNGRNGEELSSNSHNLDLLILQGMFNFLIEIKEWLQPNPIHGIKKIKKNERELAFLTHKQIDELLKIIDKSPIADQLAAIFKICLSTGARIMEAVNLQGSQISPYKITFTQTKGKKNRTVPISEELYSEIYKPTSGRIFTCSYGSTHKWLTTAFPDLPKGQATHVLRHTFASHFMMNGGNIIVLQKILGHVDIKQTMVYAHFSPDHLNDAIELNPLYRSQKMTTK
ncbi:phage integrase [Aliivibrio fischeri]|uniref:phage integrase n=1 Tax=Aliivibrio fischeri TaxID=668 RepID=UPI0007C539CB|nr:tyrosine-type recombinase/integrase [Aliivibrio fischeri]MBP3142256.1 tyrosine-type recombinase/integrase [Aliivibrio fischeri]MBP3157117.1 tyrosine-type recombinase/integrase [Aliivibrio fischeri]MCE7575186.1 tyrosine-type recombinase/integrase [Aliivibrio fischeri]